MPQKYDKYMQPLPGYKADPEKQKSVQNTFREAKDKREVKRLERKFKAEPEELKILDALEKLAPADKEAAAEGLLIARVAQRKKLTIRK
jgi:hypothetical protein